MINERILGLAKELKVELQKQKAEAFKHIEVIENPAIKARMHEAIKRASSGKATMQEIQTEVQNILKDAR